MTVTKYLYIFFFELLFYIFDTNTVLQSFIPPSVLESENIIHLLMQFIEYAAMFFLCLKMTELKVEKTKLLKAAVILLPMKIISDIVSYYVTIRTDVLSAEPLFNKFIWDIFHVLHIFIIFAVIWVVWKPKKNLDRKKLAVNAALLTFGVVGLAVSGVVLSDFINDTVYKYNIDQIIADSYSPDALPDFRTNFEYYINSASEIYGIVSVFIRTLILFSVSNIFGAIHGEQVKNRRITAEVGCVVLCYVLNLCFNNANVFSGIYYGKAVFEKEPSVMTVDYDVWQLLRGIGSERHIWCAHDVNYVYIGDEFVCRFKTEPLASSDWLADYGDTDRTAVVCETTLIAYKNENGEWHTVRFDELDKAEENSKLTEVLINVCKTGNLEAINYAFPYLDRYEPELIIEISADSRKENAILSDDYFSELYKKTSHRVKWLN